MLISRKTSVRAIQNRHEIQNKQNEATVYLYGEIGGWFGIDHEQFIKDFNKIDADVIHLRIDSSGGDIFAARSIKTAIMQHKAKVIGHVDGLVASAASFLIMGTDEIEIVDGGFFMIHNALSFMDILGYFNAGDLNQLLIDIGKEVSLHEKINQSIANDYAKRTGLDAETFLNWMAEETWFTAKEALDNKLVDRIYNGEPVEGSYDLSVFMKVPESLKMRNQKEAKRTIEKALREAGLSNKQAKAILAEGYKDDLRDEDVGLNDTPTQVQDQRDVAPVVQRDVEQPKAAKRDRVSDLLIRAEMVAPAN